MSRDALIAHLKTYAVRTDGPFTLRSGATSSWYLDGRQVTFDGDGAWLVGRAVFEALDPEVEAVGGMTMGADPIAIATAMVSSEAGRPLKAFSIRKEAKGHGAGFAHSRGGRPGLSGGHRGSDDGDVAAARDAHRPMRSR